MATMNVMKRNLNLQFTTLRLSPITVPPEVITSSRSIMMTHNDVAVPHARNFITYNRVYIRYCSQSSKTNEINML
jgi:hypothetical protein